jgi:Na+/melibiose symporter-like transporter
LSQAADAAPSRSLGTIAAFAAGSLPLSALGVAMAIAVQPYFAQDLGVSLITIAAAFSIVRLLDLGVDVLLAIVMDRTRTPIGRYRVWMVAGAPILMLAVYQLFMAKRGIGMNFLIAWLLVYALGNSMVLLSRQAWSATLVTRYDQRSRFYGVMAAVQVVGNVIIIAIPIVSAATGHAGMKSVPLMGWAILALIALGITVTALAVPEPINADAPTHRLPFRDYWELAKKPEVLRLFVSAFSLTLGPGWMSNLYLFFFIADLRFTEPQSYILLGVYLVAGLVGAPLIGLFGARFSKHRTLIASTVCYSLGLCMIVILPRNNLLATAPIMFWCGFMAVGFDLMTSAMMADVGDEIRLQQGKERMALLFAATGLAQKLAAAGAVAISYPLLAAVGYIPSLAGHNTPAAIRGLELVFILGPIFFVALGGLCFLGWKLDAAKHAEIRRQLAARDAVMAETDITREAQILVGEVRLT